jgi:hypothetical protein
MILCGLVNDTISERPAASDFGTEVCNDDDSIALHKQVLRKVVTWIFWREERTKNPVSPFFR